jgi:hypothetical protein
MKTKKFLAGALAIVFLLGIQIPAKAAFVASGIEQCRMSEPRFTGPHSKGFPIQNNMTPYTGVVNVAIIPIDFHNAPATSKMSISKYKKSLRNATEWSKFVSGGKMKYNFVMADSWIRAPKGAEYYTCPNCGSPDGTPALQSREDALREAVTAADKYYDFSNIDYMYFLVPDKARLTYHSSIYGKVWTSTPDDGSFLIPSFMYSVEPGEKFWSHVVHEVLHDQGFSGHGPSNGSDYGIMMNQWAKSKSLVGWDAFIAGWYDEDDVLCLDSRNNKYNIKKYLHSLDKIGGKPGLKTIVIRTADTRAIVVEYRTAGRFSKLSAKQSGMTAYRVDVSQPNFRCDFCGENEQSVDQKNWWSYFRADTSYSNNRGKKDINHKKRGIMLKSDGVTVKLLKNNLVQISN